MLNKWKFMILYSCTKKDLSKQSYMLFSNDGKKRFWVSNVCINISSIIVYTILMQDIVASLLKVQSFLVIAALILILSILYFFLISIFFMILLPIKKKQGYKRDHNG